MHTCTIDCSTVKPIRVDVDISRQVVTMDVDTGAAVSILSEKRSFNRHPLH